jgi:hypothetical protein
MGERNERNKHDLDYTQPVLEGLQVPETQETELDNCLILSRPIYKDSGKQQVWECAIHAQPSLFQPDIEGEFLASASNELAVKARRKSLKPGDRVAVRGVVRTDTFTFSNGDTKTINRIALSQVPQVTAKEKRISTTVYEQQTGKKRLPR